MTASLQDWVGRTQSVAEVIGMGPAQAMAALLDRDPAVLRPAASLPFCWHWLYLHAPVKRSEVGPDGHPRRGGWLPPVPLIRRMWAGSRLRFHAPLRLGELAERRSVIESIEEKTGRSGPLVFVRIRHSIRGPGGVAVEEEQDLVFRDPPAPGAAVQAASTDAPGPADWRDEMTPDSATLFRFSALTMNGHRIHYDHRYATGVEGYRGLVVHGPLTALLLLDAAGRRRPTEVATFSFQARSPLFVDEPITLMGRATGTDTLVWAAGPEGQTAVQGTIGWRS